MATAVVLPALGTVAFANGTQVTAPADGVLQVTKADGTGTAGTTRVVLGANAATGGASLVLNNTTQRLASMTGSASAYVAHLAEGFIVMASPGGITNAAGTTGLTFTSSNTVSIIGASSTYATADANGRWSSMKIQVASKATNYTVTAADSAIVFDNTGAGGTVVTFTLPASALGLQYTFSNVLTTALSQIVIAPQAADTIAFGSKAANQSVSSPVATRSSITLVCTAANTWAVTSLIGTWS
jgi:hypothetical protein